MPRRRNSNGSVPRRPDRRRPGGNATDAQRPARRGRRCQVEAIAERRTMALELRKAGGSYREIARQLGVDVHTAHADVEAARGEGHRACRLYGCSISGELRALDTTVQRRRILLRNLHLPLAPTDGSLTRNFNKTRVRLWTDRSPACGVQVRSICLIPTRSARADGQHFVVGRRHRTSSLLEWGSRYNRSRSPRRASLLEFPSRSADRATIGRPRVPARTSRRCRTNSRRSSSRLLAHPVAA